LRMLVYSNILKPIILHTYPPMKMEQTECAETSAHKIQTPGNYPETSIQHSEHGEGLKSRIFCLAPLIRLLSPAHRQVTTTLSQLSSSVFILLCCPHLHLSSDGYFRVPLTSPVSVQNYAPPAALPVSPHMGWWLMRHIVSHARPQLASR